MSTPVDKTIKRLGLGNSNPPFKQVSSLIKDDLEMRPLDKFLYTENDVPGYEFQMLINGEDAGTFTLLIESDFEKIRDKGNVGVEANRKFYGHDLPYKGTDALLPLLKEHGINSILITHDTGKGAIKKACDQLSAEFLDTIESDDGVKKDRYVLKF